MQLLQHEVLDAKAREDARCHKLVHQAMSRICRVPDIELITGMRLYDLAARNVVRGSQC